MAGATNKINSLIAREFSFVQELVWSPPRRNPFPRCTDKIVSDFRKLEVLYRRPANVSLRAVTGGCNNVRNSHRVADYALEVLDANADELIRLRRFFCKELLLVQKSSPLGEFERQAEVLMMQHLDNAWGSCKQGSVETWASKVKELNFDVLYTTLQQLFASLFGYSINHREGCSDYAHNLDPFVHEKKQCHKSEKVESISYTKSSHGVEESDDDAASELDFIEDGPPVNAQGLPLVLITNNIEVKHENKFRIPNVNSRMNLPIQIEMTMKARICTEHITAPEQYCWHIIFGIVNHDHRKVAVHSLTYWSLDNESEVSTIKWPKGGVILKEVSSLLSYACRMCCTGPDSPRVAFNWQYRTFQKYPVTLRLEANEAVKERTIEPLSPELLNDSSGVERKEASKAPSYIANSKHSFGAQLNEPSSQTSHEGSHGSFYKRLGNLLPWKDSSKKARMSRQSGAAYS